MKASMFLFLTVFCICNAVAAPFDVSTSNSTIGFLYTYGDENGSRTGDVVVDLNAPANATVCRGGWIGKSDSAYQQIVSLLTVAKITGARVYLNAESAQLWSGSSEKFCRIRTVGVL